MHIAAEPNVLTVCYNFGCKSKGHAQLNQSDLDELHHFFVDIKTAKQERMQIRSAIAKMEQIVARTLPTRNDVAGNYKEDMPEDGQLDCIDESMNTTTYLVFFESNGWLKHHTVQSRVVRTPHIFDYHWAAVIREYDSGQLYAVDSWFDDNGKPPVIEKLEVWQQKGNARTPVRFRQR